MHGEVCYHVHAKSVLTSRWWVVLAMFLANGFSTCYHQRDRNVLILQVCVVLSGEMVHMAVGHLRWWRASMVVVASVVVVVEEEVRVVVMSVEVCFVGQSN